MKPSAGRTLRLLGWCAVCAIAIGSEPGEAEAAPECQSGGDTTIDIVSDGTNTSLQKILVIPIVSKTHPLAATFATFASDPTLSSKRTKILSDYAEMSAFWTQASYGNVNLEAVVPNCFYKMPQLEFRVIGGGIFQEVYLAGRDLVSPGSLDKGFKDAAGNAKLVNFSNVRLNYKTDVEKTVDLVNPTPANGFGTLTDLVTALQSIIASSPASDDITVEGTHSLRFKVKDALVRAGSYIDYDLASSDTASRLALGLADARVAYRGDASDGNTVVVTSEGAHIPGKFFAGDGPSTGYPGGSVGFQLVDSGTTNPIETFWWLPLQAATGGGFEPLDVSCVNCPVWNSGAELINLIRPGSPPTPPPAPVPAPGVGVARLVNVDGREEVEFAMRPTSGSPQNIGEVRFTGGKWSLETTLGVHPTRKQSSTARKDEPSLLGGQSIPEALQAFLRAELANDGCLTNIAGEVSAAELANGSAKAAVDTFIKQFSAIHVYLLSDTTVFRANAPFRTVETTIPLVAADDVKRTGSLAAGSTCTTTAQCATGLTCHCSTGTCTADLRYGVVMPTAVVGLYNSAKTLWHEVGHNLTLPDLYDNSGSDGRDYDQRLTFPGTWDAMADQSGGSHPDVSMKQMRGWVDGRKTWSGVDANPSVFNGEIGRIDPGAGSVGVEYIMTPVEYSVAEYDNAFTVPDPTNCGVTKDQPCRKKALVLPLALDPSGLAPVPLAPDSRWLSTKFLPPHFIAVTNRQHRFPGSMVAKGIRVTDNLAAVGLAGFGAFDKPVSRGLSHTLTPMLANGTWPVVQGDPIPAVATPPVAFDLSTSFPAYPGVSITGIETVAPPAGTTLPESIRVRVDFNPSLVDLAITDWQADKGIFASNDIWFSTNADGPSTPPTFPAGFTQADVSNVQVPIGLPATMFEKDTVVDPATINGGAPLNWIHVRVSNIGNLDATSVKLRVTYNSPGQIGAPINWLPIERRIEANGLAIPAQSTTVFSIPWTPGVVCPADATQPCKFQPIDPGHTCLAVEVSDWTVAGPSGGVQNADTNPFNNKSQENISQMPMFSGSPWRDEPFEFEVQNSWNHDVDVRFQTQGLHPGYSVAIDEPITHLGPLAKRKITGVLRWDSDVIPTPSNQNPGDPFWQACNAEVTAPYPVTAPHCQQTWGLAGWAKRGDAEVPLGGISFATGGKPVTPLTTTVTTAPDGAVTIGSTIDATGTGVDRQYILIFIRYGSGKVDTIRQLCSKSGICDTTFTPAEPGAVTVCTQLAPDGPFRPTEPVCRALGNYERWNNVPGTLISQIPLGAAPNVVLTLDRLEAPANVANDYGARITGLITAPTTGNYKFFIAGDDAGELYLGTSESPASKTRIAYHDSYTGVREWTKFPSQASSQIALQAGKRYYIEALVKEGGGNDHLEVGWLRPGDAGTVPGELVPISGPAPVLPRGQGFAVYEKWVNISGSAVSLIPVNTTPSFTQNVTRFEGLTNIRDNYGARIRAWLTPPTTGIYRFWISGDDNVALYLSQQGGPENKTLVASHQSYTGRYEWNKFGSQKSAQFYLTAGQRYYIEALMKEHSGHDHFAVGWLLPGQAGNQPSEVIPGVQLSPYTAPPGGTACSSVALNRASARASSQESSSYPASKAIDGHTSTRWSSAFCDPQWLKVDLGEVQFVKRVKLHWEAAASANYDIQISNDGSNWTTLYTDTRGNGGIDDITGLAGVGRYVRVYSRTRTTGWGVSLYEVEVFGDANESCNPVLGERFDAEGAAESEGCSVSAVGTRGSAKGLGLLVLAGLAVGAMRRRRQRPAAPRAA